MPGLKLSLPSDTLPGVDQTAALLRAALRRRRNAVTILEELAHRAGQPRTRALAAQLARQLPDERVLLQNPLVARLGELGYEAPAAELAALAYFIDLERGALGPEALRDCPPPLTEVAAFAVTRHLLWSFDEEAWDRLFPGTYAMCQQACRRAPLPQILQSLRQLEGDKTPLDLLHELTSQSRTPRALAFLDSSPELEVLPAHEALAALLSSRGKTAPAALVAAMSTFADVELGLFTPGRCSLYSLLVTANSLEVKLVPLAAPDAAEEDLLVALCRMSGGGLLAAYPDGVRFLPTEEDVREHPGSTGQALAALPLCHDVTGDDLEGARWPILACFATEDGVAVWRLVGTCDDFEQYGQTFSFTGTVVGLRREGPEGAVLELPDAPGMPALLHELSRSALVGQRDELLEEAQALADLRRALRDVLQARPAYEALSTAQLARLCLFDPGLRQLPLHFCPHLRYLAEKPQHIDTTGVCLRALRDGRPLPFEPLRKLLESPDAGTRAAAAHLLAWSDQPRLVLEFELMRLRFDACPEVCAAARRSLAQLVVGQALRPLPPARPPAQEGPEAPDAAEMTAQLRRMGLSPARARTQAEWLAGLQHALDNRPGHQYLALLEPERIGSLRKHALVSWRRFAKARDTSLTMLVAGCNPLALRVDYESGVRWPAPEIITISPDKPLPLLDLLAGGGSRSRVLRLLEPMPLDPWRIEIYQDDRQQFAPLMHPFCPEIEERFEDYELLTNLYPRADLTDWRALARDLGRTFELPEYQHRTILRMLLQLGRGGELAGRS